jgi:hypothetical protein
MMSARLKKRIEILSRKPFVIYSASIQAAEQQREEWKREL